MKLLILIQIAAALVLHVLACQWKVRQACHPEGPLVTVRELHNEAGQPAAVLGIYPRAPWPLAVGLGLAVPGLLLSSAVCCVCLPGRWTRRAGV